MPHFFNIAGPCDPAKHYMLPPEQRLPGVRRLIEREQYFVIHAPRQTGKTTCFRALAQGLTAEGRYAAVHASCEEGQAAGADVERGVAAVLQAIARQAAALPEALRPAAPERFAAIGAESRLGAFLGTWCEEAARPVVLFLDEIDALLDATLLSVLRQLRAGFASRPHHFPHSVALIGLRDVRDYRAGLRPEADSLGTASPFNIKAESLTLRSFTAEEVAALYAQHSTETGQAFSAAAVDRAFDLTRGQPWLVNALAAQIVDHLVPNHEVVIEPAHVEAAEEILIQRRDTHLDSLIERLREPRVRRIIEPLLAGGLIVGDRIDDDLAYTEDLGLVTREGGRSGHVTIANPIYHQVIPRALAAITAATIPHQTAWYVNEDGSLDMARLLDGFVAFWLEHGEVLLANQPYHEVAPHLVLMAFLQRVVNSGGTLDREYAVGRGRMDLLVRWPHPQGLQREALEIKVWRDDKQADPLASGLEQLGAYLTHLDLSRGTLLLFDRRPEAPPLAARHSREERRAGDRTILVLRL